MSITLEVNEELRNKIEYMVQTINKLIILGKENIYREEAIELINKFGLNELLFIGCKLHKLPTTKYLELPQKEITEDKIESILYSLSQLLD